MNLKYRTALLTGIIFLFFSEVFSQNNLHPTWSGQSNIYEVNVRQYTPEGTFKAFEKSLPRLKNGCSNTLVHADNANGFGRQKGR